MNFKTRPEEINPKINHPELIKLCTQRYGYRQFGFIYRIFCKQTNYSYIGQSRKASANSRQGNKLERLVRHYKQLKQGCHPDPQLQKDWNQYGPEEFEDEILEVVHWLGWNSKSLMQQEQCWRQQYKPKADNSIPRNASATSIMNFSTLMRRAAEEYIAAKTKVLQDWEPPCGCKDPGKDCKCESCPSLAVYENLIRDHMSSRAQPDQEQARTTNPQKARNQEFLHQESLHGEYLHYDHERSRNAKKLSKNKQTGLDLPASRKGN